MNINIFLKLRKHIVYLFSFLVIILFHFSCSDASRPYEDLIDTSIREYAGKVDSVSTFFGINKAKIKFKLSSDPSVRFARIYWTNPNGISDSIQTEVSTSDIGKFKEQRIENLEVGTYTYTIVTFKNEQVKSLNVETLEKVVDENYGKNNFFENFTEEVEAFSNTVRIVWKDNENEGFLGSVVSYKNTNDETVSVNVPPRSEDGLVETVIYDYKEGTIMSYYSIFQPSNSLDSYVTNTVSVPIRFDYTLTDKQGWDITAEGRPGDSRTPAKFIDGKIGGTSYEYIPYTSSNKTSYPATFEVGFNKTLAIDGAEIINRADVRYGHIKKVEYLYSNDNGATWKSIGEFVLPTQASAVRTPNFPAVIEFDETIQATNFRIVFLQADDANTLIALGELNLFQLVK